MAPPKTRGQSLTGEENPGSAVVMADELALRFVELLKDDQVLSKMRTVLFPSDLADKIDSLTTQVSYLNDQLKMKDVRIAELEDRVTTLEGNLENQEQYTRRANLRFQGFPETPNGEDTDKLILDLVNDAMSLNPPLQQHNIERSHRLGPPKGRDGQPRTRAIIVRFHSERVRDTIYRARGKLKYFNQDRDATKKIWVNEDLTDLRAELAYKTRSLKKSKNITDCWTAYGKVMIKDLANKVHVISQKADLQKFL